MASLGWPPGGPKKLTSLTFKMKLWTSILFLCNAYALNNV